MSLKGVAPWATRDYWRGRQEMRDQYARWKRIAQEATSTLEVKFLEPTNPNRPWTKPRCEGQVEEATARWRATCGKDDRCERRAHYVVNGKNLCKTHAGALVLKIITGK